MKIVNRALSDMENNPIMAGDKPVTVALVLMNAALAQLPVDIAKGESLPGNVQQMDDYLTAVEMSRVGINESFELSPEQFVRLSQKLPSLYPPLVAGQVRAIIEGKV